MYKNIKLSNWKTGDHFVFDSPSQAKKRLKWTKDDWIHIYPVLRRERLYYKDYCLTETINKEYKICCPDKKVVKVKNWIKFCFSRGLGPNKFYKNILKERVVHTYGYCLAKNKGKINHKITRIITFKNTETGEIIKTDNIHSLGDWRLSKLVAGSTKKTRDGWIVERIDYEKKPIIKR